MSKQFNKFLIKILLLSSFFVVAFNIGDNLINASLDKNNTKKEISNTSSFKKINNSNIGKTGVAISTNIGIRYKQLKEQNTTIYKDIFSVSEILSNQELAKKELIGNNMLETEEYRNVLKTNIKQLLENSSDKHRILNAYIDQLEFRYVKGANSIKTLNNQKSVFLNNMKVANEKIAKLKIKIDNDFKNNDSVASLKNIDKYLEYKKEFNYSRTYIVYINHFLSEYNTLSNYNKKLLDTLINNKDALVKDSFVVIPDSGAELLKRYNLLYNEEQFKK